MKIHTPNLDRLAAKSMIFTNAHTPAPACAPTRAAILTGVHHTRSGAEHVYWGDGPKWREFDALKQVETLEQFFKHRGYKTLGGGKIYHSQAPPWAPTSQAEPANWDFYYPSAYISHPYQIRAPDEIIFPPEDNHGNRPGNGWWTWGPIPISDEKMADFHVIDWASYELKQRHEKPFFLAAGVWKPHDPWEVPQKYFDMYPLDEVVLPLCKEDDLEDAFDHGRRWIHKWVIDNDEWKKVVQSYAAAITFSDAMLGRLIKTFENSDYANNTILVVWSDHEDTFYQLVESRVFAQHGASQPVDFRRKPFEQTRGHVRSTARRGRRNLIAELGVAALPGEYPKGPAAARRRFRDR
jgi:arylsulfatase A-like enzyme